MHERYENKKIRYITLTTIFLIYNSKYSHYKITLCKYNIQVWLDIDLLFSGEDPEDFIREFRRYVVGSKINVAPGANQTAGREEAFRLLLSYLEGDAKRWYETCVKGKTGSVITSQII